MQLNSYSCDVVIIDVYVNCDIADFVDIIKQWVWLTAFKINVNHENMLIADAIYVTFLF